MGWHESQLDLTAATKLTEMIRMASWLRPRSHPSGRWAATTAGAVWHRVGLGRGARPPRRYSRVSAGRRRPEPAAPWAAHRLGAAAGTQPRVFFDAQVFADNLSRKKDLAGLMYRALVEGARDAELRKAEGEDSGGGLAPRRAQRGRSRRQVWRGGAAS
jgi:hypothetical protein